MKAFPSAPNIVRLAHSLIGIAVPPLLIVPLTRIILGVVPPFFFVPIASASSAALCTSIMLVAEFPPVVPPFCVANPTHEKSCA